MTVRGMDISNHQALMDVERVVRENDFGYVFILTNDGTFVNQYFHAQADAAERGGAIVRPYTYLRPNWAQTIDVHLGVVGDRYGDSIVDVEDGSGGWYETWSAHNRLWDRGQTTNLLYWPNFHWTSMGSPDLSPLAGRVRGHWKSWYPDRNWEPYDTAWAKVPGYVWNDTRGGIPVSIVQFTGTGRVSGYGSNVDLNYYPGSRAELEALLGGDDMAANEDLRPYFWDGKPEMERIQIGDALANTLNRTESIDARTARMEVVLAALQQDLSDDEVKILASIRQGGLDPAALAAALAPYLPPGGASKDEVEQALRNVLRTGTEGSA